MIMANPNPETAKTVRPKKNEPKCTNKKGKVYPNNSTSGKGDLKYHLQWVIHFHNMNNMDSAQEHKLDAVIRNHSW